MSIIDAKKSKNYWVYFIIAGLLVVSAVIIAPIWSKTDLFFKSWGAKIIDTLLAIAILYYVIIYLFKKISTSTGAIQILTVIEAVLLCVIALGCILSQFKVINLSDPCKILGLALWLRGTIEIVRAYFYKGTTTGKYTLWQLAIAIAMVSFGAYIFARPFISKTGIQWIIVVALLVFTIYTILYGISANPSKKSTSKSSTTKSKEKKN